MREYLFRGKRKDNGEWVEGSLVTKVDPLLETSYCFILAQGRGESFVTWHMVDPSTVGQFTGLLDKNGKRIFEGDIVRFTSSDYMGFDERGCVVFHEGCFGINYKTELAKKYGWSSSFHRIGMVDRWEEMGASGEIKYTYEVIGNIHDNPGLVEGVI